MKNTGKHIKFVKYNLIKPPTAGQIKFKENKKIKLPNKCKAQNRIFDLIRTSRKKIKGRTRDNPNSRSDLHEQKKNSKTHYQRRKHEVVEELTFDRHERRVEDPTRK